jgi:hypothetical protein
VSPQTRIAVPARLAPVALAAVLAAVLGVAGCQPASAGAAAIIGSDRLPVSTLQHDVDALLAEGGGQGMSGGTLQRTTVERWVYSRLVDDVAAKVGVTVTDGDVAARIAQVKAQVGDDGYRQAVLSSGVPLSGASSLVRMVVQLEQIGQKLVPDDPTKDPQALEQERQQAVATAVGEAAANASIEVNPRYGAFDVKSLSIQTLQSGGLAADEKTPAPKR